MEAEVHHLYINDDMCLVYAAVVFLHNYVNRAGWAFWGLILKIWSLIETKRGLAVDGKSCAHKF